MLFHDLPPRFHVALQLDSTGDLNRSLGTFTRLDAVDDRDDCIGQRIAVRLRRWRGEWSYDTRLGMPWETLLTKGTTQGQLRAAIIREVSLVPGVRAVSEMTVTPGAGRVATVSGRVSVVGSAETVAFSADVGV